MSAQLSPETGYEPPEQNGLGLAAFIVSLVGLFSVGILSPVAVIMGAIAMRRDPKGFALAGLIIGLFGSLWLCLVAVWILFCAAALGIGIAAMVMSIIYVQIEDGINGLDNGADIILQWQSEHDGALPTTDQGTMAFSNAGFNGSYQWVDGDDFIITLVVDEGDGDPWTFVGEYDISGDRESLRWESKSGNSHGNWNFD